MGSGRRWTLLGPGVLTSKLEMVSGAAPWVHCTHGSQQCSAGGRRAGTSDPKASVPHGAELDRDPSPPAELPEHRGGPGRAESLWKASQGR